MAGKTSERDPLLVLCPGRRHGQVAFHILISLSRISDMMAFNPQSVCPRQVPNNAPFLAHGGPMFGPYASSSGRQTLDAPRGHHGVESPTSERPAQSLTAISEGLRLAFFLPILCRVRSLTPSRLFNDPEYSDLEVRCGNRTWKVHRVIVCGRCEFFKACVDRNFKVSRSSSEISLI